MTTPHNTASGGSELLDRDYSLHSGERPFAVQADRLCAQFYGCYQFALQRLLACSAGGVGGDIFCGSGYGAALLARNLPCSMLAIDGSQEAITQAAACFPDPNLFFSYKLFPFSLPEQHFDFIVSMASLEHVPDSISLFALLVRALKPGGELILSVPNREAVTLVANPYHWHYCDFTAAEMLDLGEQNGLQHRGTWGEDEVVMDANGKVVVGNYCSPVAGRQRPDYNGTLLTCHFHKPAAER